MTAANRTKLSIAIIALVMVTAAIWSLFYWSAAGNQAEQAAADVQSTQNLVNDIIALRPTSLAASPQGDPATRLPGLIDDAMKSAQIEAENLDRISPQTARPLGQSSVSEIPMQLVFNGISLHQLLTFVDFVAQGNDWICVRDLHLQHPPGIASQGSNAQWNVELTFSYLTDQQKESSPAGPLAN